MFNIFHNYSDNLQSNDVLNRISGSYIIVLTRASKVQLHVAMKVTISVPVTV